MSKFLEWCVRLHEWILSFVNKPARFEYKGDVVVDRQDDYKEEVVADFGPKDEYYPHPYSEVVKEESSPEPEKKSYKRKTSDSVKLIVNNKKKSK